MAERKVQDRPIPWKRRLALILLFPLALALQWFAAANPGLVERVYARQAYPVIARIVSALTGWIPFALSELVLFLLLVGALLTGISVLRRVLRRNRSPLNALTHGLLNVLALCAVLYAWGLLFWGLNYQRQPLATVAGLDASRPTAAELADLSRGLIAQAAELRSLLAEDEEGVIRLREGRSGVIERADWGFRRVGLRYPVLAQAAVGPPKQAFLSSIVSWMGLRGFYLMHTAEPMINAKIPVSELPATVCHELAHQAGFAREDEANFVGYLACAMHPDAEFQYSAALDALEYALRALAQADPQAYRVVRQQIPPGIRRDWSAQRAFWEQYDTPVNKAVSRINDAYLRSQGEEEGVRSYGRMVDLLVADRRVFPDPPRGE